MIALAMLAGILVPVAHAAYPGENGKVLLTNEGLFQVGSDGEGLERFPNTGRWAGIGAWSPDGRKVAYGCLDGRDGNRDQICVSRADGSNRRVITDRGRGAKDPDWAPYGRRIVFVGSTRTGTALFTVRIDGSHMRKVVDNALYPAWGVTNRIVFVRNSHVFTVRPNGEGLRRVTRGKRWIDQDPDWAPHGRRIVFSRARGEGVPIITIVRSDGRRITQPGDSSGTNPAWSPNGRKIVYDGGACVSVMRVDGRRDRCLVDQMFYFFDWQPRPG